MRPLPWAVDGLSQLSNIASGEESANREQRTEKSQLTARASHRTKADDKTKGNAEQEETPSLLTVDLYEEMRPGYDADDQFRMVEEGFIVLAPDIGRLTIARFDRSDCRVYPDIS